MLHGGTSRGCGRAVAGQRPAHRQVSTSRLWWLRRAALRNPTAPKRTWAFHPPAPMQVAPAQVATIGPRIAIIALCSITSLSSRGRIQEKAAMQQVAIDRVAMPAAARIGTAKCSSFKQSVRGTRLQQHKARRAAGQPGLLQLG